MQLPACQAAQAPAPPRRILVVDDNKEVARSLVTLLTMEGHEARAAYSGAEAVEVAQEIRPEVVFMDIGMPSMNGHQACRRIREFDWGNGISLIALTGWGKTTTACGQSRPVSMPIWLSPWSSTTSSAFSSTCPAVLGTGALSSYWGKCCLARH